MKVAPEDLKDTTTMEPCSCGKHNSYTMAEVLGLIVMAMQYDRILPMAIVEVSDMTGVSAEEITGSIKDAVNLWNKLSKVVA